MPVNHVPGVGIWYSGEIHNNRPTPPPPPPPIPSQRYNPKSLAQIEAETKAAKSELDFVTAAVVGYAVGSILSEGCDADSST